VSRLGLVRAQTMTRTKTGFTLIELMIVVAIIGLLAALAVPNFIKFQTRARQTEARANLKAIWTDQKAYYADKATYYDELNVIGFAPEFNNRYAYFGGGGGVETRNGIPLPAPAPAASTCATGPMGIATITADQNRWGVEAPAYAAPTVNGLTPNPNGIPAVAAAGVFPLGQCCPLGQCEFAAGATGNIDGDNAYDGWFIASQGSLAGGGAAVCQNPAVAPVGNWLAAAAGEPVNVCNDVQFL
jgi:type IV pilus assembly protein PilA